ncbi:MAG: glycosyltransferase family 2 protein [Clostridia bacterium]|nr:glycosyltransferase family 2 protein [Clostridia bacterium]
MLDFIWTFNRSVFVFFTVFYSFQILYTIISLIFSLKKPEPSDKLHRYAVMIAARNEEKVIAELIRSIKAQTYPQELIDIYVVADNCIDKTAQIAKDEGAEVIERHDLSLIGKGYALDYAFAVLKAQGKRKCYDGFFVFDADNVLDENFIFEMNKMFGKGYRAITGYRNSKNFEDNWITSSYTLWFLREAAYLNKPRMILNTSCAISGTGYLVRADIIEKNDGWKYFLLTEDIEFNANCIIDGEQIGYCEDAVFYDEQPRKFKESWNQRLRWMKGTYQVLAKYGYALVSSMFKSKPLAKYDMLMTMAPALIVTFASASVNLVCLILAAFENFKDIGIIALTAQSLLQSLIGFYFIFMGMAVLTVITEWRRIKAKPWRKIVSVFAFPFFIFTYIPISIIAIFKKVKWIPINHDVVKSAHDLSH